MSKTMTIGEVVLLTGGTMTSDSDPDCAIDVSSVTEDSRKVQQGTVFVAIPGEHSDGHDFIDMAREMGAVAVISDRSDDAHAGADTIVVQHARRALGVIAHALQGDPSRGLNVIGVTGTNGKSSTVMMIRHLLQSCGHGTACFGTLGNWIGGSYCEAQHTTSFNEELADLFARARDAGDTHVVMEVSSHALEQERVAGVDFDVALFTNLTQDHLDYHDTMESYRDEKLKLFASVSGESGITIANADDPACDFFRDASRVDHYTFGETGDLSIQDFAIRDGRSTFYVKSPWGSGAFDMGLLGRHNVSNVAGALAVCGTLGLPFDQLRQAVATMPSVPGRFELIECERPFQVVVDYAHTEDGLRNVLTAAREVCSGRVIALFGCGGDRDKSKRPKMAQVVAELADFGIVTSDNPRTESPERILMDIEVGMQRSGKKRDDDYCVIEDRKEAIHAGLAMAAPDDLVLIAGKGHEDYQILNSGRIHFDDREVAREWLGRSL